MNASTPITAFPYFSSLPAELRLKIWRHSFHARVLELHPLPLVPGDPITWQSNCANHPALFACRESRREAQSHYVVALPVGLSATTTTITTTNTGTGGAGPRRRRLLYLSLELDMVVILGGPDRGQTVELLHEIGRRDPLGRTPRRLGLGLINWATQMNRSSSRGRLPLLTRELLDGLEQLVLLMYAEQGPPAGFRDGECFLEPCDGWKPLWRAMLKRSGHERPGEGDEYWSVIGNVQMMMMNLGFKTGRMP